MLKREGTRESELRDEAHRREVMTLLKRHRMAQGLSQKQIAARLKVAQATYNGWENGRYLPRPCKVQPLARILGVNPLELMTIIVPEQQPGEAVSK